MTTKSNRLLSSQILQQILLHNGSLATLLPIADAENTKINPALIQEICYGVCRHFNQLDFISTALLNKPLRKKDWDVRCLILIGLYQLFFMRTPAHAAINETVAELQAMKKPWAKALVNAVLRQAQRQHDTLKIQINANFCYKFSHPDWLISALKKSWPKHYQQILRANNQRAPMTLRVNLQRSTRNEYLKTLAASSIVAHEGLLAKTSVILDSPISVLDLPGFFEGIVSVQDEASQLSADLLDLQANQVVLDACAAPGGKTCAILEHEPDLKQLIAVDLEQKRLLKVKENLDRIGLTATLLCTDINKINRHWENSSLDRILLDVPCSATGVIRRHPDIKLLKKPEHISELSQKQQRILKSVWPLLKPGGLLLYSTCSILNEENSMQIAAFIKQTPNAKELPLSFSFGHACEFGRQLIPGPENHDGFYYALLQKC